MVLHIFVIHRPNLEENERIFEVSINRQAFSIAKREGERRREKEIEINLKMIPHVGKGGKRERALITKSSYKYL